MKGFLIWHKREFRKTHSLVELGKPCVAIDATLDPLLGKAVMLTDYAAGARYPGEDLEPSQEEADDAVSLANQVFQALLARLPAEAHPGG